MLMVELFIWFFLPHGFFCNIEPMKELLVQKGRVKMEVRRPNIRLDNAISKELSAIEKAESRLQKKSKATTTSYLGVIEFKTPDGMSKAFRG